MVVAAASCAASLWWLYDGDWATVATDAGKLGEQVGSWDADQLAKTAGFSEPSGVPVEPSEVPAEPAPETSSE